MGDFVKYFTDSRMNVPPTAGLDAEGKTEVGMA